MLCIILNSYKRETFAKLASPTCLTALLKSKPSQPLIVKGNLRLFVILDAIQKIVVDNVLIWHSCLISHFFEVGDDCIIKTNRNLFL